ncbi:polyamine aminopropyltransferase [Rhodococcus sp. HNM0569]|uniref:polyamine aminopropyltransferase n=1 Tax=Rhodococcus sp. HNM0569 TaxID=2716340 RepID=UPI00146D51B2|nr:polyamine aminopropyltransferase [Rhodococcus sp. HNM0569]NLU82400.1 polyamine aminopropyltransferase [Rhodococcus sp. HNM0569]
MAGPLSSRARAVLLAAVAACAACGLIYELALLTLSASLVGGGITQTSMIVAGYVAALGVGALVAKPFLTHAAVTFVVVEILLGLIGGFSAAALYVSFTFLGSATALLVAGTALIGLLVGAEVPLLMTLLQTGRRDDAASSGKILANLNAADYAGALVGGLLWPFVLLPLTGMIRGAAVTGIVNLAAAAVVALILLRGTLGVKIRVVALLALTVAACLILALLVRSSEIETTSRQRLYTDPIVAAQRSQYQEIVVTRRGDDTRLFLDGDLQFSSVDEHRYTESLVYPVLSRDPQRVLVLGGGDGLAARELLRTDVREIVQVELDPAVIGLANTTLAPLNGGALEDPRVHVVIDDAFQWLRGQAGPGFDAVVVDLPDPDTPALGRLYSTEFYGLASSVLAPNGQMVVQAGSPYSTPNAFWRTVSSVRSVGLAVTPYHVYVPSFGDWGFVLADASDQPPALEIPRGAPELRFLDETTLATAGAFPRDRPPLELEPSTLDHPRIVDDMRGGYQR